ncbi:hypothetical protein NM208_g183 [Fusarium decemcellulare]|uniref:Uncharacterized protein n=1 Tax=Fusarium decemcellulare TaxID=57161 RepID=A0ACC1T0L9_9HYPO|nr:hypothetical protein NM208_g183 [Fusarium decemcellulare]
MAAPGMPYEPLITPHHPATFSILSPCEITVESSTAPLELIYGNLGDASYQDLHPGTLIASGGGLVASPPLTPSTDNRIIPKGLDHYPSPIVEKAKSRRRMQNRESQRRFRERKEQLQKTLQQQVDNSRSKYEALLRGYNESTTEITLLLQENDALRSEVKDLRRQRRLMLSVMKMLRGGKRPSSSEAGETADFLSDVMHYLGDVSDDPATPDTN